ncbi:hypothetical protein [Granulicella sp. dw_53]|uniref:hypothetical protein n=1 Tax=Granulicella sp. dw_53 TaxID=2719792 RepID=UPI002103103B|nr:hypothetical protein [Granulicella sp. dw_53]
MKRMYEWMAAVGLSGAMVLGLAGCKPSGAIKQGAVLGNGTKAAEVLDPETLGSLSGKVRFEGKPPARVRIDMSQDPACVGTGQENYSEQYVVHQGGLANVYIYMKSGPAAALAAPPTTNKPVVMDQKGCQYAPHVVAVMRSGMVEFRSSDATMHNIHTLPEGDSRQVNVTQRPKGTPEVVRLQQPEVMMPVRCDLHPWMTGFINVSDTPFFAVTDEDGQFEIEGLPEGTYVFGAVHERLGEQTLTVTIEPHETGKADFRFGMK